MATIIINDVPDEYLYVVRNMLAAEACRDAEAFLKMAGHHPIRESYLRRAEVMNAVAAQLVIVAPPYPFCRSPEVCAGKGYCPQEKPTDSQTTPDIQQIGRDAYAEGYNAGCRAGRAAGREEGLSEAYNIVTKLVWRGDKSGKDDPEIVGDILDALGKSAP